METCSWLAGAHLDTTGLGRYGMGEDISWITGESTPTSAPSSSSTTTALSLRTTTTPPESITGPGSDETEPITTGPSVPTGPAKIAMLGHLRLDVTPRDGVRVAVGGL
ncbi:MAG: hypothetical protein M1274_10320 [Actinobacteria bacterium]|nr:hypothetical protein [Actinomycetota bacterium]